MQLPVAARHVAAIAGVLSVLCLMSVAGAAQSPAERKPSTAVERGKDTFRQSCASCHGERGDAKGAAPSALDPRPADLTRLTKRNGTTFPRARVEATIKATDPIAAHGSQGMLVWGAIFLAQANGNQAAADARISDLVTFIESIQVK